MAPTRLSSTMTPKCSKFNWTYEPAANVYTAKFFGKLGVRERIKRKTNCTIITLYSLRPLPSTNQRGQIARLF